MDTMDNLFVRKDPTYSEKQKYESCFWGTNATLNKKIASQTHDFLSSSAESGKHILVIDPSASAIGRFPETECPFVAVDCTNLSDPNNLFRRISGAIYRDMKKRNQNTNVNLVEKYLVYLDNIDQFIRHWSLHHNPFENSFMQTLLALTLDGSHFIDRRRRHQILYILRGKFPLSTGPDHRTAFDHVEPFSDPWNPLQEHLLVYGLEPILLHSISEYFMLEP